MSDKHLYDQVPSSSSNAAESESAAAHLDVDHLAQGELTREDLQKVIGGMFRMRYNAF
jgi:hypothetical protein